MGWGSKRNSELLALMLAGGFNAFVTVDQNLEFQQNIRASGIAVIVTITPNFLVARNAWSSFIRIAY